MKVNLNHPETKLKEAEAAADEDSEEEEAAPVVTPKKRGRPSKSGATPKKTPKAKTPVRKSPVKRGRPKKYPVSEDEEEEEEEMVPVKKSAKKVNLKKFEICTPILKFCNF